MTAIQVTKYEHCSLHSNCIPSDLSQLLGTINLMQFKTILDTFEILTVVAMKSIIFSDVTLCSPVYSSTLKMETVHSCETSMDF
jgi:hypothetical protein